MAKIAPSSLTALRTARPPQAALSWVASTFGPGSRATAVRYLPGGQAQAVHAVEVLDGELRPHEVVLRRWVRPDWELTDPDFTVGREALALRLVAEAGVPAPRLQATDSRPDHCDVPALLMSLLPGSPYATSRDTSAFTAQLARAAHDVHTLGTGADLPPYRPYNDLRDPRPPVHAARPEVWDQAFNVVAGTPPSSASCLIHRDYHPGNTLWQGDQLTGIVDWSYASYGPVSIDLAHMRWNLVLSHGRTTAGSFLDDYLDLTGGGFEHHPYWDLRTVVDLMPEPTGSPFSPPDVLQLEGYLDRLLAQI
ncbi:phosphotransferase family protein [Streptomyces decoyicus]|uniref:phosphotransferase family protein n=1 Tax=Streptomyces decoyicus TaxID=249567 RepID=UPI003811778F